MTVFEYILLGLWLSAMAYCTVRLFSKRGRRQWSGPYDVTLMGIDVDMPVHHHETIDHGHHSVLDHIDFHHH
jgi:hypothetical protein